jgi:hypothetical protein
LYSGELGEDQTPDEDDLRAVRWAVGMAREIVAEVERTRVGAAALDPQ